jgi:glycosyltransferase involved in cell wall biosynthesis
VTPVAKKFILADQSISSIAGHHYEYAVHVLHGAERAGYQPVLASHVRFAKDPAAYNAPWKTLPVYNYGFWAAEETPRFALLTKLRALIARLRFRWRIAFRFSPWGLAWETRTRFSEFLFHQPIDKAHALGLLTLIPAVLFLKLLRLIVLLLLLPVMALVFVFRTVRRLLIEGGFPQSYARSLLADAADFLRLQQLVFERRVGILKWLNQYRLIQSFARDTEKLLRAVQAGEGDIVYLPTVSPIDLMGLARLTERSPQARKVSWRIMMRRDIYRGREREYAAQEGKMSSLRETFQICARKLKGVDVRFFTDTDELTAQYNRLGTFPFATGPIPHTHTPRQAKSHLGPLRVIYVGDARKEKGYNLIPGVIQDLWDDYVDTGKVTFHLQSNYNIPQGEPEAVIARMRMEGWPENRVELIKKPMTSDEYREFLLSGDINLLLYDATNYYARSSGILVESLTAGVPVIVPAGSWLARQFLSEYHAYVESLRGQGTVLRSYTTPQLRWQVHGNPRLNACTSGEITATQTGKAFTWIRVPAGSTHVLINVAFSEGTTDGSVTLDQIDGKGNSIWPVYPRLVEAGGEGRTATLCLPLHPKASKLWLALGSLYPQATMSVCDFRLDLLSLPGNPPLGAVSLIYHDLEEVPGLLRDLIDNHPHYAATAAAFADGWRAFHNADRLVEMLA